MADYWKSQAKKFCDFCKCWISDNKPSIGFHESGKRHKENVTKRLAEISKKSAKSYKEELQVDQEMKKMEEEALKAFMKDLQENPDYTSKKILEEAEKKKNELEELIKKQKETENETKLIKPQTETVSEASTSKIWHEAKSDEGFTYYWNINTSESVWEPPEGFVSLEEQEKEAKIQEEIKKRKKEEKGKLKLEENNALKIKENTKKKSKKSKDKERGDESNLLAGPSPKPDPYGAWTEIEPKVEEPLDLELPQLEYVAIKVPEFREPEIKFKEKTISSLEEKDTLFGTIKRESAESPGGFKKRKLNKGNMRQKLDTD